MCILHFTIDSMVVDVGNDILEIMTAEATVQVVNINKLWCEAQQTPAPCCDVAKDQKQQFCYILSR